MKVLDVFMYTYDTEVMPQFTSQILWKIVMNDDDATSWGLLCEVRVRRRPFLTREQEKRESLSWLMQMTGNLRAFVWLVERDRRMRDRRMREWLRRQRVRSVASCFGGESAFIALYAKTLHSTSDTSTDMISIISAKQPLCGEVCDG